MSAPVKSHLSEREKDICRLMMQGMTNVEIGDALYLSPHTIKTHLRRIFTKVGAHNRTQAAMLIAEKGML